MMIMNGKNKTKISYTLLRVVWKLFEVDKKIRYYGTDEQLFESEMHMIKAIEGKVQRGHRPGMVGMLY